MAGIVYLDFDLEIERTAQGYRVEANSPTGQATHQFTVPFSDLEVENFVLRLGRTRRGVRRIDSPEVDAAKTFGARLFDAVFGDEIRGCLRSSLDEASRQGGGLRIRLRLNDTPELADLPWEYLYSRALNRFLVLSSKTPIVRYLELPERVRPLAVAPPLRILVMIASPKGQPPLDVQREWAKLQAALQDLEQRGMVVLERLEQPTLTALQRRLRRGAYNILHFIGHGGFDQQRQDGVLLLEDEDGYSSSVSGQDLGTMLYDHDSLRLAVLNACEGARTSRSDPFAGVAQSLVQQGIPAVIAMQFEVTDEAAITLAHEFYSALADSYPIDAALAEARKSIFAQGEGVEWGTPVLYLRAPDGRIFDIAPVAAQAPVIAPVAPPTDKTTARPAPLDGATTVQKPAQRGSATIQSRLSDLGCQFKLMVQLAMLLVVLIGSASLVFWRLSINGRSEGVPPTAVLGSKPTTVATTTVPTLVPVTVTNATAASSPDAAEFASWKNVQTLQGHSSLVTSVAFSPDGKTLASGSYDGTVLIWRVSDGAIFQRLTQHTDKVTSVAFSSDGQTLASGSWDQTIRLWNVSDGTPLDPPLHYTAQVWSVAFSPNGTLLASGSRDTTVQLWSVADRTLQRTLPGHTAPVWSVAFSPDGQTLASAASNQEATEDTQVRLWRVPDGEPLRRPLQGHTKGVLCVAFSPNGKLLASGSVDRSVRLWSVADGKPFSAPLMGHADNVYSVAFSPDSQVLASGSLDGTVRLWRVADGMLLHTLEGASAQVWSVAFAPDGRSLAAGLKNGQIWLWGAP